MEMPSYSARLIASDDKAAWLFGVSEMPKFLSHTFVSTSKSFRIRRFKLGLYYTWTLERNIHYRAKIQLLNASSRTHKTIIY